MCLTMDKKEVGLVYKRFARAEQKGKNYITCYKALDVIKVFKEQEKKFLLRSPYYSQYYEVGWNYSDRKSKKLTKVEIEDNEISHGIHVYLNMCKKNIENEIPVRCYKRDFISADAPKRAVFMKIFITKKDYNEFINKVTKL